ncbi:MAG TPA: hypothetical protein VK132_07360, partial [Gemmatimonadales bacterium]|nr:hypothetical protein [Gemmatimonadales bacterium]
MATSARRTNSTYRARDQLKTSVKPHTSRGEPSSGTYRNCPKSTCACSPGAVSNRRVGTTA